MASETLLGKSLRIKNEKISRLLCVATVFILTTICRFPEASPKYPYQEQELQPQHQQQQWQQPLIATIAAGYFYRNFFVKRWLPALRNDAMWDGHVHVSSDECHALLQTFVADTAIRCLPLPGGQLSRRAKVIRSAKFSYLLFLLTESHLNGEGARRILYVDVDNVATSYLRPWIEGSSDLNGMTNVALLIPPGRAFIDEKDNLGLIAVAANCSEPCLRLLELEQGKSASSQLNDQHILRRILHSESQSWCTVKHMSPAVQRFAASRGWPSSFRSLFTPPAFVHYTRAEKRTALCHSDKYGRIYGNGDSERKRGIPNKAETSKADHHGTRRVAPGCSDGYRSIALRRKLQ